MGSISQEPRTPNTTGYLINVTGLIQPTHKTNRPRGGRPTPQKAESNRKPNSICYKSTKTNERKLTQLGGNRGQGSAKANKPFINEVREFFCIFTVSGNLLMGEYDFLSALEINEL